MAIFSVAAQREGSVPKFQDHQRRAAECLRLAREATDKTNKALLIEMAQTWPSRTKPEARMRSRNSPASQPQPGIAIFPFGRSPAPWIASLNKKPSQTQPALRILGTDRHLNPPIKRAEISE
jgi:hypothetical protein